jgi:hypothetical protein
MRTGIVPRGLQQQLPAHPQVGNERVVAVVER